eukprot:m.80727 g.80727  ORF g.80727 m.80727 type:complete len:718 (+) comp14561_c0_seq3:282-2435(+)
MTIIKRELQYASRLEKPIATVVLESGVLDLLKDRRYGRLAFCLGHDLSMDVTADPGTVQFDQQVAQLARRLAARLPMTAISLRDPAQVSKLPINVSLTPLQQAGLNEAAQTWDVPESILQAFQQVAQLTRELQQSILDVGASPRRLSPRPRRVAPPELVPPPYPAVHALVIQVVRVLGLDMAADWSSAPIRMLLDQLVDGQQSPGSIRITRPEYDPIPSLDTFAYPIHFYPDPRQYTGLRESDELVAVYDDTCPFVIHDHELMTALLHFHTHGLFDVIRQLERAFWDHDVGMQQRRISSGIYKGMVVEDVLDQYHAAVIESEVTEVQRAAEHIWPNISVKATGCHRHSQGHHIFVSYRQADGEHDAGLITNHLSAIGYDVFLDRDCLGHFPRDEESLLRNVYGAGVFIMVLTPGYLDIDKLNDWNDWCRKELEAAVESGRVIVPFQCSTCPEPFPVFQKLNSERVRLKLTALKVVKLLGTSPQEVLMSIHSELQRSPLMAAFVPPILPDAVRQLGIDVDGKQGVFQKDSIVTIKFRVSGVIKRVCLELVDVDCNQVTRILELAYLCHSGLNIYEWHVNSTTDAGCYVVVVSAYDEPALCRRSTQFKYISEHTLRTQIGFLRSADTELQLIRPEYSLQHFKQNYTTTVKSTYLDVDVGTSPSLEAFDEDVDILINFLLPATASLADLRIQLQTKSQTCLFYFEAQVQHRFIETTNVSF